MKKINLIIYIFILIILLFVFYYISLENKEKLIYLNKETNQKNEIIESIDAERKVMLLGVLGFENEGKIYNESDIDKQLQQCNIKPGIFVTDKSRDMFIRIVEECTGERVYINDRGYIEFNQTKINNEFISRLNDIILSNRTLIIDINDTYDSLINDIIVKFMIERLDYSQSFTYNDSIEIALINPYKLNEDNTELSKKEIYEEVLLSILSNTI